jgi:aldose 1-epimerase
MITKHYFGTMDDGCDVHSYLLKNDAGMSVRICEFGGAIMEICVPDRLGRITDVVAGYDSLRDYVLTPGYLGALVGRVCNRIAKGKFRLGGKEYQIYKNNNGNSLHGGKVGFSHKVWDVKAEDGEEPRLILTLASPNGDENYPGTLSVTVTYTLLRSNALSIHPCFIHT